MYRSSAVCKTACGGDVGFWMDYACRGLFNRVLLYVVFVWTLGSNRICTMIPSTICVVHGCWGRKLVRSIAFCVDRGKV